MLMVLFFPVGRSYLLQCQFQFQLNLLLGILLFAVWSRRHVKEGGFYAVVQTRNTLQLLHTLFTYLSSPLHFIYCRGLHVVIFEKAYDAEFQLFPVSLLLLFTSLHLIVRRLGRGGLFLGSNGGWGSWNLTDRRWKPFLLLRGCELWTLLTASDIIELL